MKIGDCVRYFSQYRVEYKALVTAVWSSPAVNVCFVSDDENKADSYGRQIERDSSVRQCSSEDDAHNVGRCYLPA